MRLFCRYKKNSYSTYPLNAWIAYSLEASKELPLTIRAFKEKQKITVTQLFSVLDKI